jgi:hypothetical protein
LEGKNVGYNIVDVDIEGLGVFKIIGYVSQKG